MQTQLKNKENAPYKPCIVFKNAYIYLGGGFASVLSARFADPLIGKLPSIFGNGALFWKSAYTQLISDNVKEKLRKEMHVKEYPENAWKMGIVAGTTIGVIKPIVTTFWNNLKKYHKEQTQSEPTTFGPYSSLFSMCKEKGITSFFEGYAKESFTTLAYTIPYNGIKEYNNYWMKKKWLPHGADLLNDFWVSFVIGSVSATQAVLVSKPLELTLKSLCCDKDKIDPKTIAKKTLEDIKKKGPKTGIKVFLWSNAKRQLPNIDRVLQEKFAALKK
ncbi:solute carrier family 25 [Anaeramoeba flamelloides]|uniref:Solute carrier family 25 n=1 Tax=Anaeramoeba flamelloides TaxID=1746091 RepID=A0ABQ8XZE7_9EUKA|nr:solute carrier family 25 [Anaeramoeba flamelloides]